MLREHRRERRLRAAVVAVLAALSILVSLLFLGGCASTATVVPAPVESRQASFDGGEQSSGILAAVPGGFIVTPRFRARYNGLVATYGGAFLPPLVPDAGLRPGDGDTWFIDAEHMAFFLRMNAWRRAAGSPL